MSALHTAVRLRQHADDVFHAGLARLSPLLAAAFDVGWRRRYSGHRPPPGQLRLHGNWCGPGWGGGPCLTPLDCLCRSHDLAYAEAATHEDAPIAVRK